MRAVLIRLGYPRVPRQPQTVCQQRANRRSMSYEFFLSWKVFPKSLFGGLSREEGSRLPLTAGQYSSVQERHPFDHIGGSQGGKGHLASQ